MIALLGKFAIIDSILVACDFGGRYRSSRWGTKVRETIGRKDPAPAEGLNPPEDLTVCMFAHILERK